MTILWLVMVSSRHIPGIMSAQSSLATGFFSGDGCVAGRVAMRAADSVSSQLSQRPQSSADGVELDCGNLSLGPALVIGEGRPELKRTPGG
jgi:hypothetical protein